MKLPAMGDLTDRQVRWLMLGISVVILILVLVIWTTSGPGAALATGGVTSLAAKKAANRLAKQRKKDQESLERAVTGVDEAKHKIKLDVDFAKSSMAHNSDDLAGKTPEELAKLGDDLLEKKP